MDDSEPLHPAIRGLKTVCRCNNIKYRTIERAIREGATTLSAVADRTTATTGECGGTCTPDVQQMIAELAPRGSAGIAPRRDAIPPGPAVASKADAGANDSRATNAQAWWIRKK